MNIGQAYWDFIEAMIALDMALTGKSRQDCEATARSSIHTIEDFVTQRVRYLSDGGYSRVALDLNTLTLFYTDNSLRQVKDRWNDALPQREAVEKIVRNYVSVQYPDGVR